MIRSRLHCFKDINKCLEILFKGMDTDEHLTDLQNAILRAFPMSCLMAKSLLTMANGPMR
jgi:hypothetical protein